MSIVGGYDKKEEVKMYLQQIKRGYDEREAQDRAHNLEDKEYVRSVMKIMRANDAEVEAVAMEDDRMKRLKNMKRITQQLKFINDMNQEKQKKIDLIKDKCERSVLTEQLKLEKRQMTEPLKKQLDELHEHHKFATSELPTQEYSIPEGKTYKDIDDEIKLILKEKNQYHDKGLAYLEIARRYLTLREEKKALQFFERATNLDQQTEQEDFATKKSRARDAHKELFLFYIGKNKGREAATHMERWLEYGEPSTHLQSLEFLEKILSDCAERIRDHDLKTSDKILRSKIIDGRLGSLSDLRCRVLSELLVNSPTDPYLLESLGQLYVRLQDYDKAFAIFKRCLQTPDLAALPLWADIDEFQTHFQPTQ